MLEIVYKPTATLIPYARNARTHDEAQIAQIAGSIKEFSFCNPVLIDAEDGIIAGHGRVLAAQLLKMDAVPCVVLGHLTDTQKRAYILADNQLALKSGWDNEMLLNELSQLNTDGFLPEVMGFDEEDITALGGDVPEDEDEKDVDLKDQFDVLVICTNEKEQQEIYAYATKKGLKCRTSTL